MLFSHIEIQTGGSGRMNTQTILCPFCNREVECMYIPSVYSEKHHGRNALGRGVSITKSTEILDPLKDCECGKTINQIKRAMREGTKPDMNKVRQRYNEIMKLKEELKHDL